MVFSLQLNEVLNREYTYFGSWSLPVPPVSICGGFGVITWLVWEAAGEPDTTIPVGFPFATPSAGTKIRVCFFV